MVRSWILQVSNYFKELPGKIIHIIFDNYDYNYQVPSKDRAADVPRVIPDVNQRLPREDKWSDFLSHSQNKCQFINLIVEFIFGDEYHVNNGDVCYHKEMNFTPAWYDPLHSTHKVAHQKFCYAKKNRL